MSYYPFVPSWEGSRWAGLGGGLEVIVCVVGECSGICRLSRPMLFAEVVRSTPYNQHGNLADWRDARAQPLFIR